MILKRYSKIVIFRVLLISINIFFVIRIFENPNHLFSILISCSLLILQLVLLIRFLNQTNRNLANFLSSILYKDGTFHVSESSVTGNDDLSKIINSVGKDLNRLRIENQKQYAFLKTVINHMDTAIMVFNAEGNLELYNQSLLNLFKKRDIKTILELDDFYSNFSNVLNDLLPKIPKLLTIKINNEEYFLSVRASVFKLEGKEMRLVSFHIINEEMNETEMRSWEKLIRVLTHEIMNSVSPITSLTTTLKRIFKKSGQKISLKEIKEDDIDDTISGLEIIYDRSQGLLDFIKKYRQVHLMPKPVFEEFEIESIFDRIGKLFKYDLEDHGISLHIEVYPKNIKVSADKAMLEQVFINLIKNSIESFKSKEGKYIKLKAFRNVSDKITIEIVDNGEGISDDIKDDIFVPFFSTKKKGSGIGLSLVKQLVLLNNAKLSFKSEPNSETRFTIIF